MKYFLFLYYRDFESSYKELRRCDWDTANEGSPTTETLYLRMKEFITSFPVGTLLLREAWIETEAGVEVARWSLQGEARGFGTRFDDREIL